MRVAIIGAGASGLTAARALLEVGISPVVYEQSHEVGGLWVYGQHRSGPAYRSLRTNTSRAVTAFSDFPFDPQLPHFPSHEAVLAYLSGYEKLNNIRPLIRFGCTVRTLTPLDGGGWSLGIASGENETQESFDAVMVCSGIFSAPVFPANLKREEFHGRILHSLEYRVPEVFAGEDVLVVGLGSSAVDIALDLIPSARSVTMSVRRGAWIAPRTVGGRPLDHGATRASILLPESIRTQRRKDLIENEYARKGISDIGTIWHAAGVTFHPNSAPSVTNDDLLNYIQRGEIRLMPGIERLQANGAFSTQGGAQRFDTIVFATGYGLRFPFLPPTLVPWRDGDSGLYRLVFPPNNPTLAFIGVCRVHGPVFPIVEMQARWAARVLAGEISLPDPESMREEARRRWTLQTAKRDSPIRVPLLPYLDDIGSLIGARPHLWKHPGLLAPLLFGPPSAAQYRLQGPHVWDGAGEALRTYYRQR